MTSTELVLTNGSEFFKSYNRSSYISEQDWEMYNRSQDIYFNYLMENKKGLTVGEREKRIIQQIMYKCNDIENELKYKQNIHEHPIFGLERILRHYCDEFSKRITLRYKLYFSRYYLNIPCRSYIDQIMTFLDTHPMLVTTSKDRENLLLKVGDKIREMYNDMEETNLLTRITDNIKET
jgi:hypothetical protein